MNLRKSHCPWTENGGQVNLVHTLEDCAHPVVRIICIPHASGASESFRERMGEVGSVEIISVLLPGRTKSNTQAIFTQQSKVIERLGREVANLSSLPFELFGYSLTAICADLCKWLKTDTNISYDPLIVSGCDSPDSFSPQTTELRDAKLLGWIDNLNRPGLGLLSGRPDLAKTLGRPAAADLSIARFKIERRAFCASNVREDVSAGGT